MKMFYYCEKLTEIILPETIDTLKGGTFQGCSSLTKITLPENLKSIEDSDFGGCTSLSEITIPKGLRHLGMYSFGGCTSLKSLTFGPYLEEVGYEAFDDHTICEVHINRAVAPIYYQSFQSYQHFIEPGNSAILYVPRGTKKIYENTLWNEFSQIVEEDVDGLVHYQVKTSVPGYGGRILVNNTYNSDGNYELEYGKSVTLTFDGYGTNMLESLKVNDKDVTDKVTDGKYVIESLTEGLMVVASFKHQPVSVTIQSGIGARVKVNVEYGNPFSLNVAAEEGWNVNSVLFNGRDVTEAAVAEGKYTVTQLNSDAVVNISFEQKADGVQTISARPVKVFGKDNMIVMQGLQAGEKVAIYDAGGKLVNKFHANGWNEKVTVTSGQTYLVQLKDKTIKVAL